MCDRELVLFYYVGLCEGSQQTIRPAVLIQVRQEGSLIQHYLVVGVGSNFWSLKFILGIFKFNLEKSFLL